VPTTRHLNAFDRNAATLWSDMRDRLDAKRLNDFSEIRTEKKKMVKAGENSGYDPDMDIELEWELWARLRYSWFRGEAKDRPSDLTAMQFVNVEDYGLYVSDAASAELKEAAISRFGRMYLGCIH